MRALPGLAAAACLAALAACAAKRPAPQAAAPPPAPPVDAPGTLDGTYRGTSTRYQAEGRACPGPGLVTLRVQDGAFEYRWSPRASLQVTIAGDGSLQLSDAGPLADMSISGRAGRGLIEGDVTNPSCAFHFTARKRG